ncbi:MAG: hypothetical protein Q9227_001538 [Pyrenula ochraceoflavens]
MKRFLLKTAACWWPAIVSAVPIPSPSLSAKSTGGDQNTVYLQRISNSGGRCQDAKLSLNGRNLFQSWDGIDGWDNGFIDSFLTNGQSLEPIEASWQSSCVSSSRTDDVEHVTTAQVLSFIIHRIGQEVTEFPSGFTVSFRPDQPVAEFLRLANAPVEVSHDARFTNLWADPEGKERIKLTESNLKAHNNELNQLLNEVKHLESEEEQIKDLLQQKLNLVHHLTDAQCGPQTHHCHGLKCAFQAVLGKVPEFARIVSAKLRGSVPTRDQCRAISALSTPWDSSDSQQHFATPSIFPEFDQSVKADPLPSFHKHHSPPGHIQPQQDDLPPGHHPPHRPHHHHYDLRHDIRNILVFILVALICGSVFKAFHTGCFANPRRRAERLARREERHNRRMYRQAKALHRWNQFWERGVFRRQPSRNSYYEEKRAMVIEQEGILENVMQEDIRALELAHEIVGEMMDAEEGRSRLYHRANRLRYNAAASSSSRQASRLRTDSLPRYQSETGSEGPPPPRYEEELGGEIVVVDGFQYTPSTSVNDVDESPDSSVVDCNTRVSVDTRETDDLE